MPTAAEVADLLEDAMSAAVLQATVEGYSTNEVNSAEIRSRILGAYQTAWNAVFMPPGGSAGAVAGVSSVAAIGASQKVAVGSAQGSAAIAALVTNAQVRTVSAAGTSSVTSVGAALKVAVGAVVGSSTGAAVSDPFSQAILSGIVSAQSESSGWNALLASIPTSAVVRTSDTVVTITLPALSVYGVSADETLTVTVPGSVLVGGAPIVAAPTVVVTDIGLPLAVSSGSAVVTAVGSVAHVGIGSAVGSSTVTSVTTASVGAAVGSSTVTAVGNAFRIAVGSAVGSCNVTSLNLSGSSHAYFDALIIRPDSYRRYSLRPQAGVGLGSGHGANADYEGQLLKGASSNTYAAKVAPYFVTYNPSGDSDPQAQDAAKVTIPPFIANGTLINTINSSQTTLDTTSGGPEYSDVSRGILIDSEVMRLNVGRSGTTVGVQRGQHGTTAASHSAGAQMATSYSSLQNMLFFPINSQVGNTYLIIWDAFVTTSFVNTTTAAGFTAYKAWQLRVSPGTNLWMETRYRWDGGNTLTGGSGPAPGWLGNPTHVASVDVRTYPPAPTQQFVNPQQASAFLKPGQWHRYWFYVPHNVGSGPFDLWVAGEDFGPTHILVSAPAALNSGNSIESFNVELNTSSDDYKGGPVEDLVMYVKNLSIHINPNMGSFPMPRPVP